MRAPPWEARVGLGPRGGRRAGTGVGRACLELAEVCA